MPWDVRINSHPSLELSANSPSGVTLKAVADGPGTENPEKPSSAAEKANDTDASRPTAAPDDNVLFSAVTKLNEHLTTLHAALPARTAFVLLSGHSDPRTMSALAASAVR